MNKLAKSLAGLAVVVAAVLAGPMAANAATPYAPGTPTITGAAAGFVTGSTAPGGTFTVHFNPIFITRHQLTVYFFSTGSVPTSIAEFRAAVSPALETATGDSGAAAVTATMPADASAPVTIEATDGTTTAAITIPVTGVAAPAAVTGSSGTTTGLLSQTGTYVSLATVWGAGGLIVLGIAFLGVRGVVRRGRTRA